MNPIPNQVIPKPLNKMVVHAPPSLNTLMEEFPPKSKLDAIADLVISGAAQDATYSVVTIYNAPPITVRNMSPLKTAAIKQIIKGIVAKSPKGSTVFPGKITANSNAIGTNNSEADKTDDCPTANALSIPIYNSLPGNLFCTQLLAASEIGGKPFH